jgi:hypothetical protein
MLYADIISPSHLISLKYLKFDCVNLDEREELLYIISVLKSASNLVELVIQVTRHTLCFLNLSFYAHILTLFFFLFIII